MTRKVIWFEMGHMWECLENSGLQYDMNKCARWIHTWYERLYPGCVRMSSSAIAVCEIGAVLALSGQCSSGEVWVVFGDRIILMRGMGCNKWVREKPTCRSMPWLTNQWSAQSDVPGPFLNCKDPSDSNDKDSYFSNTTTGPCIVGEISKISLMNAPYS